MKNEKISQEVDVIVNKAEAALKTAIQECKNLREKVRLSVPGASSANPDFIRKAGIPEINYTERVLNEALISIQKSIV